jgi:hypothetical protein
MKMRSFRGAAHYYLLLTALILCGRVATAQPDPLSSWNNGPAKTAIVGFVTRVTAPGGPDFVPPAERVATFDNDGTLWTEQPLYVQFVFALDRIKTLAPAHPEWKQQQPFQAVLQGDTKTLMAGGEPALLKVMAASHAGALDEAPARGWIAVDMKQDWKTIYPFEK